AAKCVSAGSVGAIVVDSRGPRVLRHWPSLIGADPDLRPIQQHLIFRKEATLVCVYHPELMATENADSSCLQRVAKLLEKSWQRPLSQVSSRLKELMETEV